jgi:hypothetical protein
MHSSQREAKMHLPPAVGLSLREGLAPLVSVFGGKATRQRAERQQARQGGEKCSSFTAWTAPPPTSGHNPISQFMNVYGGLRQLNFSIQSAVAHDVLTLALRVPACGEVAGAHTVRCGHNPISQFRERLRWPSTAQLLHPRRRRARRADASASCSRVR